MDIGGDFVARDKHETHIHEASVAPLTATPPRPPAHFTGREADLSKLIQLLVSGESVAITALQGMGGIGKTALARKTAEMLHPHFPGGVLWWTLGPQPNTLTALDVWARHADPRSDLSALPDAAARADVVRSMLAKLGRLCVILDDVWDEDSARVLLEAAPPECAILLTTRDADLAKALRCRVERLGALSVDEAVALLAKLLGPLGEHEAAAREIAAREIAALTEGLPLALELIAGLADSPAELPVLAQQLKQQQPLDTLKLPGDEDRNHSVEACFALSYAALDPETQRRFRALGVFAPAPFDANAIAAVWGETSPPGPLSDSERGSGVSLSLETERKGKEAPLSASEARGEGPGVRFLRTLTRRALLTKTEDGAYTQHALLRAYALALLQRAGEHAECAARHAVYYRRFAEAQNWRAVENAFDQISHGWAWVQANAPKQIVSYVFATRVFLRMRGRQRERQAWLETGLAQARADSDQNGEGNLLHELGWLNDDQGDKVKALKHYEQALAIAREVGDRGGEGATLNNIGEVYRTLGQMDKALATYEQALAIHREVGNHPMEGTTLNNIGLVYAALGQTDKALVTYEQALAIHREVGNHPMEGTTLNNIGLVYAALGQTDKALVTYEQALAIRREVGDRGGEGTTLSNIGLMYRALGQTDKALATCEQALAILREVGDRGGEGTLLSNIGLVYRALGQTDKALAMYEQALAILREVGDHYGEGVTLVNIGAAQVGLDRLSEAEGALAQAVALLRQVQSPSAEKAQQWLDYVRQKLNR